MIDPQQAVEAALVVYDNGQGEQARKDCARLVDAILAVPDPVHDAAREVVERTSLLPAGLRVQKWGAVPLESVENLAARLGMERPG